MFRHTKILLWWVALILLSRWLSMGWLPLADTSEPRYAEIARVMAESGDWITPWFEPGLPFWGKPPLSFWSEALAIRWLGVSDFAVRLPSWLAALFTLGLLYRLASAWYGREAARIAALVYSSMALTYVAAGAVLTDPFLVMGTTWIMVALALVVQEPRWYWRYGFFLGLAIGLLAKGPLVLVLAGVPMMLWSVFCADGRAALRALPWGRGLLLTAALTLPWYVLAELKTPGFLRYFLVGEHFLRFVDPGWGGDLYGSAHRRPHGTIWLYWLLATFPWGLVAIWQWMRRKEFHAWRPWLSGLVGNGRRLYLVGWALATPVFFTAAGNILWTYLLPALPAFAILFAANQTQTVAQTPLHNGQRLHPRWPALLVPLGVALFCLGIFWQPHWLKSEKSLVEFVQQQHPSAALVYVESRPFSARYYSRGKADLMTLPELADWLADADASDPVLYLAVPRRKTEAVRQLLQQDAQTVVPVFENHGYLVFSASSQRTEMQVPPSLSATSSCQPSCSQARLTM